MTEVEWLATDDVGRMLAFLRANVRGAYSGPGGTSPRKLRLFACAVCRQAWGGAKCEHCRGRGEAALTTSPQSPVVPCPWCVNGTAGGLTDPRSRRAVETVERHADGLATDDELAAACRFAGEVAGPSDDASWWAYVWAAGGHVRQAVGRIECVPAAVQAGLLRDVCGNPFRPVTLPFVCGRCGLPHGRGGPGCGGPMVCPWLTPDVRALARACYDERGGEACGECDGTGHKHEKNWHGAWDEWLCAVCGGTGRVATTGHLDPVRLALLADALEEAGCTDAALLAHLRGWETVPLRGPHVRGCHALDAVLGLS